MSSTALHFEVFSSFLRKKYQLFPRKLMQLVNGQPVLPWPGAPSTRSSKLPSS